LSDKKLIKRTKEDTRKARDLKIILSKKTILSV